VGVALNGHFAHLKFKNDEDELRPMFYFAGAEMKTLLFSTAGIYTGIY
jgi:hypothetical protein